MRGRWSLAIAGLILILAGGLLAHFTQTSGGIQIQDVRFAGAKGNTMSALLYIPPNATAQTPAPGILAVHGYINSRETQDGFAIEFARRGYVVLALDQTGHGYSDPPAFANGFGGPDGLAHLRSLDIVDKNNIGLEGHSMGGWTVLAAATAMPNDYKSMVLEGSSTGKPFAADGTPSWPRNVALVFAQYEEFSNSDVGRRSRPRRHPKPKTLGPVRHPGPVEPGKVYGDIAQGTARVLYTPGDHPSGRAYFASSDRLQPRLVRQDPAGRHAPAGRRPDLVPQGDRHADRADRLRGAPDRRVRRPARSEDVLAAAAARDRRRHHAGARRGRRPPLDRGVRAVRLHSRADLLSGVRAGRHLCEAVRLPAAGHHQPDHGLGRHQCADHAGADAVRAQARQPRRHHRASRS